VDVGAHLGFFSLAVAGFFKNPKIYVVEPLSLTFEMASKNLEGIKGVYLKKEGFWNKNCKVPFYFNPNYLMYSSAFEERFRKITSGVEVVKVKKLDKFLSENHIKRIDVLKLDTEGAEEKILEGAKKSLAKTHYLILECSLDFVGGTSFASIIRLLKGLGYNFQLVTVGNMQRDGEGRIKVLDLLLENLHRKSKVIL
jgi:FkbM family methyltransferase